VYWDDGTVYAAMGSAVNNETDTQQFMFCDNAFVLVLC
jgi:hypothetical protein